MQVSATLIAAQQAAREARARLAMPQYGAQGVSQSVSQSGPQSGPQAASQASFAAALEKTSGVSPAFAALPLKQVAVPQAPAAPGQAALSGRLGQHIDITV